MNGENEKILLVKPSEGNNISAHPPIGLWSIRSNAPWPREVTVWDAHLFPDARPEGDWDMIGFSLQFATQESSFRALYAWAAAHSDQVIVGGPYGSSLKGSFQTVKGDGEPFFGGKRFPEGHPARFDRDELRPYWASARPHASMSKTSRWLPIETSRGCINHCGFCYAPDYWGPWRGRSVEQVANYLSYVKNRDVEEVFIEDDAVNASTERFLGILEALRARKLWWSCPNGLLARQLMRSEVLRALEGSYCWRLSLPLETGTVKAANLMGLGRKWLDFDEARKLVVAMKSLGIITSGAFIIGWPGETEVDVKQTMNFMLGLDLDDAHIHIAQPFPGTALLAYVKANGWLLRSPDAWVKPSIETPWLSAKRVAALRDEYNEVLRQREEARKR